MKLYVYPFAPNVMRVQIVMSEKKVSADIVDASLDRSAYGELNPLLQVPALLRDDGTLLTESLTIAQYIDASSGPPFLFGEDGEERLQIGMWERRAETGLFNPSIEFGHHVHPMFAPWMTQYPDYAKTLLPRVERMADLFAARLDEADFIMGDRLTAADITALLGWFNLVVYGALTPHRWPSLSRWANRLLKRESFAPLRAAAAAFKVAV